MTDKVNWLTYPFEVCEYGGSWNELPGVYLFTGLNWLNQWVPPLYVGQADNFRTRMSWHEKWSPAVQLGATSVHVMVVYSKTLRDQIEAELIRAYNPPLNKQIPALRFPLNYPL